MLPDAGFPWIIYTTFILKQTVKAILGERGENK